MKNKIIIKLTIILVSVFFTSQVFSQLVVNSASTPAQMVQNTLVGGGVTVSNVTFQGVMSGTSGQIAEFSNGNTTNLGLNQGIVMATGNVSGIPAPVSNQLSDILAGAGLTEIDNLTGGISYDGAKLEFDFTPLDNVIQFQYVFGSEEYLEFVGLGYNDAFAFFLTGAGYANQNIALVPSTVTPVTIDNVNNTTNSAYYVNNEALGGQTIVFDGFTTVLTAQATVTPCTPYHIKLCIADITDGGWDSGVFIKANSFSTDALDIVVTYSNGTTAGEGCSTATVTATVGNAPVAPLVVNYTISGTATNGVDFPAIPASITIPAGSTSASFVINPTLDGIAEGTETVIFAMPSGCGGMNYDTVYISNNSALSVNAGLDQTLCASAMPASLTATSTGGAAPIAFAWDNGGGVGATVSVSPAATTTYTVTATDACGQTATDQVIVNLSPTPTSTFNATTPICVGDPCTVTYNGNAGVGATYNWNFNGATVQSGSGQGPYTITWNTAATYSITLTVTENGCVSTQSSQNVVVYALGSTQCCVMPTPNAGIDKTVCSLSTNLQGVASIPVGVWTCVPATAIINNPSSPTSVVTVPTGGVYTFTWTEANSASCTASDAVVVTFNQPPVANAGIGGQTCSNSFNLTGVASVGIGTWTASPSTGVSFANANSAATNVTVTNDGTYSFTWTENNNSCISSATVQVTFTTMPNANAGPDVAVCQLTNIMQAVASIGTGIWTLSSGPGNASFNTSNNPNATMTVSVSGTYTLTWTENNGNGCINQDDVIVQLTQVPTSDFTASTIACTGSQSTITYTGTGNALCTYNWTWNGGNAIPGNGQGPHLVSWVAQGPQTVGLTVSLNGCTSTQTIGNLINPTPLVATILPSPLLCNGQMNGAVNLTPTGGTFPYDFLWSNNSTQEDLSGVGAGIYSVVITDDNGCTIIKGTTVIEPSPFIISCTPSMTICLGQSTPITVSATGGTGTYNFFWDGMPSAPAIVVNPDSTTTYTATAIDGNGCPSNTAIITVHVSPKINVLLIQNADSVCPGEAVMLTPIITGGVGPPYMIINQDGMIVTPPIYVYPTYSGNYSVYVEDACGTFDTSSVYISVLPFPPADALADTVSGCQPFTVHFIEINPDDGRTYLWDFGDNENLSLAKNPVHTYTQSGTFTVTLTVTSKYGCKTIKTYPDFITVWPKPEAHFVWTPEFASIIKPEVHFTNMTNNGVGYIWTFGDGDSTAVINPTHTFPDAGSYPVELIAVSNKGCRDTVIYPVVIQEEYTFYGPSAFSPDGDRVNDFFFAIAHGIKENGFYLAVYDRWGEVIWHTNKYSEILEQSEKWDGRAKNNALVPIGTYNWLAKFKDDRGNNHEASGAVTVVR
jgi:gliding motility-associated-like protein